MVSIISIASPSGRKTFAITVLPRVAVILRVWWMSPVSKLGSHILQIRPC